MKVWRYQRAGLITGSLLRWSGYAAIVLPWHRVYVREQYYDCKWLMKHELTHVLQVYEHGPWRFWFKIIKDFMVIGYQESPLEVQARANERKDLASVS